MKSFFRRLAAEAHGSGGAAAVWAVWARTAWDLLVRLPGEHMVTPGGRGRRGRRTGPAEDDRRVLQEGGVTVEALWRDFRLAVRSLGRRPGMLAVTTVTLALGLGANTAIFSVLWGAWLKPVPYPNADRLVWISDRYHTSTRGGSSMSPANFLDLEKESRLVEDMIAISFPGAVLGDDPDGDRIMGMGVDPGFFRALGMAPVIGRGFLPEEGVPGEEDVVVLSHGLWTDHLGADPEVLGATLTLTGRPFTVVGVAPPDFRFRNDPRFFIPNAWTAEQRQSRAGRWVTGFGLLAPDVEVDAARRELEAIFGRLAERYPEANREWSVSVVPLKELMVGSDHTLLAVMGGAALLVLLVAGMNVASILLARAESRQREMAVRTALGAGRLRIVTSFLAEGLVVAVVGGVAGLWVAYEGTELLLHIFGSQLRRTSEIGMSWAVASVAAALTLGTGMAVAVAPAWRSGLTRVADELKEGAPSMSGGGGRIRKMLVVFEVAMAVTLVSGAGLLINTMWRLNQVDLGIEPDGALTTSISLPGSAFGTEQEVREAFRGLVSEVGRLPGVESAGLTNIPPLDLRWSVTRVTEVGRDEPAAEQVLVRYVTPGYFEAAGMERLAGRTFDGRESVPEGGVAPVVITEPLANTLFPGGDALGRRIRAGPDQPQYEVVGVVEGVREQGPGYEPRATYYLPYYALSQVTTMHLVVRGAEEPGAVIAALRPLVEDVHPEARLGAAIPLDDRVWSTLGDQEFALSLLSLFALVALALGAVGVYGVMAFNVAQRTREMGLRLALGAPRSSVVGLVIRQGVLLTLAGLALGMAATVGLSRFIGSLLYEVSPADPVTFMAVAGVLLVTALLACLIPARRAAAVPPIDALRVE